MTITVEFCQTLDTSFRVGGTGYKRLKSGSEYEAKPSVAFVVL